MFPEMTYGHLKMARSIIGEVLAEKVQSGCFDLDTAIDVARLVLHDNPVRIYGLEQKLEI